MFSATFGHNLSQEFFQLGFTKAFYNFPFSPTTTGSKTEQKLSDSFLHKAYLLLDTVCWFWKPSNWWISAWPLGPKNNNRFSFSFQIVSVVFFYCFILYNNLCYNILTACIPIKGIIVILSLTDEEFILQQYFLLRSPRSNTYPFFSVVFAGNCPVFLRLPSQKTLFNRTKEYISSTSSTSCETSTF